MSGRPLSSPDVFGNRTILDRSAHLSAPLSEPVAFDAGNNRATGGSWQYDAAGNLGQDGAAMAMTYDGEGQMKTAGTWEYVYDGEGRRVLKRSGTGNRTVYVYGPDGELAAEYSTETPAVAGVQYVSVDWLGSTRIVTGPAGQIQQRTDYLPFGAVVGFDASDPRSGQTGYANDLVAQKFTGEERDGESGLDWFATRCVSSAQGRFTTPDWSTKPEPVPYADLSDPQSPNLYAYVRNNPVTNRDLDGHWCIFGIGTTCAKTVPPPPPPPPPVPRVALLKTEMKSQTTSFIASTSQKNYSEVQIGENSRTDGTVPSRAAMWIAVELRFDSLSYDGLGRWCPAARRGYPHPGIRDILDDSPGKR